MTHQHPHSPPPAGYLRSREITQQLDIDRSTLARWAREGHVKAVKFGRIWYYDPAGIEQLTGEKLELGGDLRPILEVEAKLGISRRTLQRWAKEELIQAEKRGGTRWYVSVQDAERLSQTLKPGPEIGSTIGRRTFPRG